VVQVEKKGGHHSSPGGGWQFQKTGRSLNLTSREEVDGRGRVVDSLRRKERTYFFVEREVGVEEGGLHPPMSPQAYCASGPQQKRKYYSPAIPVWKAA